MPNMKALSERVQNLLPMLKLSNKQTNSDTVCYRYRGHKNSIFLKPASDLPGMIFSSEISFFFKYNKTLKVSVARTRN